MTSQIHGANLWRESSGLHTLNQMKDVRKINQVNSTKKERENSDMRGGSKKGMSGE